MDIRSGLDGLKSMLGVSLPDPAGHAREAAAAETPVFSADRATLSDAGNQVAQGTANSGVRADKIAAVQSALAAGTYRVPGSAVASRIIDSMVEGEG